MSALAVPAKPPEPPDIPDEAITPINLPMLRTFVVRLWNEPVHEEIVMAHICQIKRCGALVFSEFTAITRPDGEISYRSSCVRAFRSWLDVEDVSSKRYPVVH